MNIYTANLVKSKWKEESTMLGEWIRRTGFFALDVLKGGKVTSHYRDISNKMNGNKDCLAVLPNLLRYVKENVPYYRDIENPELHNFPVVKKSIIMEKYKDFQSREYIDTDLHWTSTSGSTGTPFKASQNLDKRKRTIAELIYFHRVNGWNLGEKYIYLRAWTSHYAVSKLRVFLQNYISIDVVNFGDQEKESMRQMIKTNKKIRVILGYASGLDNFVKHLEEKGDNSKMFNIRAIFTVSDNLSDVTRSKLEKMFGCPVINRYSNEEHGVLACTSPYDKVFKLNTASYFFELLKLDSDEPVEPGEIGRLVVTDLYNRSMPFIRYDSGDLAMSDDIDRKYIKTLSSLQGRVTDIIRDTRGNIISAPMVNNYFHRFYKMKKYQLIQNGKKEYMIKVVCDEYVYDKKDFIHACKELLGETAVIDIKYVNEIPVEKTGKYKTVVNQYIENSEQVV